MACANCRAELGASDAFCPTCGAMQQFVPAQPAQTGATHQLIPYKNPMALTSYYLGVFSVIPMVGILLGAIAVTLGVMGLRYWRANPQTGGQIHSWIGILAGGFFGLLWLTLLVLFLVAVFSQLPRA